MNVLLLRMRSLLAVFPVVVSITGIEAGSYAAYTASALLALFITKADLIAPRMVKPLLIAELLLFTWLADTYGGILFLLPFSTLIAAFRSKPARRECAAWTLAGCAALAAGLYGREPQYAIAVFALWATSAVLLYTANDFEKKRYQSEDLYEALARSNQELHAAKRRMRDYTVQIETYAQTEERNRIAMDIHDDLGHRLIRVKMMSEAALHLFDTDTARARDMVGQMRDQLQDSMERMRRTVRRLAVEGEDEPRRYALDRLVAETAEGLGIDVRFKVHGIPRPIYPSMELVLFKNAQEAITNAVRHGGAASVVLDLRFERDQVSLTVANDGTLPDLPIETGLGMKGMRDRIALIGGKLEWKQDGMFAITTTLPLLGG